MDASAAADLDDLCRFERYQDSVCSNSLGGCYHAIQDEVSQTDLFMLMLGCSPFDHEGLAGRQGDPVFTDALS